MKRTTVCTHIGCAQLVTRTKPCPKHGRPLKASWSPDRDRTSHHKLRAVVVKARGPQCERCGWQALDTRGKGLQMHHIRPGDQPENVILLCGKHSPNNCHAAVDTHAR